MFYKWAEKQKYAKEKSLIFWWQSKKDPRPNIGDFVAYDLVNRIIAMKGKMITGWRQNRVHGRDERQLGWAMR